MMVGVASIVQSGESGREECSSPSPTWALYKDYGTGTVCLFLWPRQISPSKKIIHDKISVGRGQILLNRCWADREMNELSCESTTKYSTVNPASKDNGFVQGKLALRILGPEIIFVRGMVKLVPAVAYHFCLNLPAIFSQPRTSIISGPSVWAQEVKLEFSRFICG